MFFFQLESIEFEQFLTFFHFLMLTFAKVLKWIQNVQLLNKYVDISHKKVFEVFARINSYIMAR
ncbi:hypothetical protein D1094_02770 [Colwellia sp. RSH04]|nr:hypothetical protein D1094_02770 [Colwellia sp. RSH04]